MLLQGFIVYKHTVGSHIPDGRTAEVNGFAAVLYFIPFAAKRHFHSFLAHKGSNRFCTSLFKSRAMYTAGAYLCGRNGLFL